MSDSQPPNQAEAASDSIQEVRARVTDLQAQVVAAEKELLILEGRVRNLSPQVLAEVQKKTEEFRLRLSRLERAHIILIVERLMPHSASDQEVDLESFKKQVLDFCKSKKVEPEIWKKLES